MDPNVTIASLYLRLRPRSSPRRSSTFADYSRRWSAKRRTPRPCTWTTQKLSSCPRNDARANNRGTSTAAI
eukprot:996917-Pleurochrysis_carterae.AAC.1